MKKILICLYAYYPFENSNTNVMMPLIKELSKEYEIHILTENVNGSAPQTETDSNNITVHRYHKNSFFRGMINLLADIDMRKKRVWYEKLIINIATPITRVLQRVVKNNEYMKLKELTQHYNFSLIISTCERFTSHRNVLRMKLHTQLKTPWIAYFMDPFSYYIENREIKGEHLKIEQQVYEISDLVLTTEEIYHENKSNNFAPYLDKTRSYKYSNLKRNNHELVNDIFIPKKINCVYVGSLFSEKIRSPKYFYKIINQLDDRFHFHIICNGITKQIKNLYDKTVIKKHNVTWYNNLPLNECLGIMCHADLLINLGNKSINQTPSKIFDYIGTGRPIVNFYSLEDDTSKRYLKKYPCKININESDDRIDENARLFKQFAEDNAGSAVDWSIIEKEYQEYNSDVVTRNTLQVINEYFNMRRTNDVQN